MDAAALKPFTRALTCLSKYGDDLNIYASPDKLALTTTNSSRTAHTSVTYGRRYFTRYVISDDKNKGKGKAKATGDDADDGSEIVAGQLLTKSLLSILKHRNVEKTVERCELSVVEGAPPTRAGEEAPDDDHDSLESKLIIRLHCKHGIVKTHRLVLLVPSAYRDPLQPDPSIVSRLTIGPRTVRDIIEHFPSAKVTGKNDPQLVWQFEHDEVIVKSVNTGADGKAQLSTQLMMTAEEFDVYDLFQVPVAIAFHLREFNATITFAESMSLPLHIRFTDPTDPLFVDVTGDRLDMDVSFAICTSDFSDTLAQPATEKKAQKPQGHANDPRGPHESKKSSSSSRGLKRPREESHSRNADAGAGSRDGLDDESARVHGRGASVPAVSGSVRNDPARAVRADAADVEKSYAVHGATSQSRHGIAIQMSMPPPSIPAHRGLRAASAGPSQAQEPLFLPGTQLSQAEELVIRESGLGILDMNQDELDQMLEGDGEEVISHRSRARTPAQESAGRDDTTGNLEGFAWHAELGQADAADDLYMDAGPDAGDDGSVTSHCMRVDGDDVLEESQSEAQQPPDSDEEGETKTVLFRPLFED
ncbi:hypothetical protein PUNSTDRAFT_133340 [Punctularia strigosozonata HHB-11173 SS5]|uniref:uncharacterized protein n=1 Tax=Punctularia strigosozonata (strain HHB-11173) TaxID=741275 RepID=UPI00044181C1|nr:uncharacterized protein PUNSTDRAFT_133340 [Punctularia strigosozonata HHB-11173 SS5]EIN09554.1 hypothetical protein PUNSTDRAFT_133340 [Punctularia strigosozonata HHB-11173 SS5]